MCPSVCVSDCLCARLYPVYMSLGVEMKPQLSTLLAETGSPFASVCTPGELACGFLGLSCLCLLT